VYARLTAFASSRAACSQVVGEGEHKIMDFIRRGRASGDFSDETRHW
jgi:5'-3' exonuclease